MARGRMLSRDVSHDLELNEVSLHAALLFTWSIAHLDVEGRMPGHPKQVLASVVPMSPHFDEERVRLCLAELHRAGLIFWYRADRGRLYLSFPGFDHHNTVRKDREAPSKIPDPEEGTPVEIKDPQGEMFDGASPDQLPEGAGSDALGAQSKVRERKRSKGKDTCEGSRNLHDDNESNSGELQVDVQDDPAPWMHEVWREELGIRRGPSVRLTEKRKQKYRSLYEEHLKGAKEPRTAFRMILKCVQDSDHHMSKRSYQMPDSLFRNEERRDTWVQETISWLRRNGGDGKRSARRNRLARQIEARRGAAG